MNWTDTFLDMVRWNNSSLSEAADIFFGFKKSCICYRLPAWIQTTNSHFNSAQSLAICLMKSSLKRYYVCLRNGSLWNNSNGNTDSLTFVIMSYYDLASKDDLLQICNFIQNIFSKRQVTMIFRHKDPGNNVENFFLEQYPGAPNVDFGKYLFGRRFEI